jgi:hypothetical protein
MVPRKAGSQAIMNTQERLDRAVKALDVIDRRRGETGDVRLGRGIEHFIVRREIQELENEILADPGALEIFLVRRK